MKINPIPQYKINYKSCTQDAQHQGEKMNFVCLNEECSMQSLICSFCREEKHKGHITKPLKFYIEDLKKQYENEKKDFSSEFERLEESRVTFLIKLRQSVEKVAEEFRKLEEEVIEKYDQLQQQILQEQSRQNKFTDFYLSLSEDSEDKPEFLIQNYLPHPKIEYVTNMEPIETLGKKLSSLVYDVKTALFSSSQKGMNTNTIDVMFKLPPTISKSDNIFTQTNIYSQETLCVIPLDLVKNFQNLKFKIKIIKCKVKKGGAIHFGAINKKIYEIEKHKNFVANLTNKAGKLFYYANNGTVFGQTASSVKVFNEQSVLQITVNHDILKIGSGKGYAEFKLPQDEEHYLFFNLFGETSIEFTHLPK